MKKLNQLLTILFLCSICTCVFAQKPQEPKAPFNYNIEEVQFNNTVDSIRLAGTLTLPKDRKKFATVILISGSGAQNRDSEIMGHKPFLVIADYLSNNGIGVLRVDDRGAGSSGGDYNTASLEGFKRDTQAAINYLKSRKDLKKSKIGLIGHSLGGLLAPMLAADSKDVAFIVLMAGPGIRGDKLMLLQRATMVEKAGADQKAIDKGQKDFGGAYKIMLASKGSSEALKSELKAYFTGLYSDDFSESRIDLLASQHSSPWIVDFIKHDPATVLNKVKCPVLALNGSEDVQVPAKVNLKAIKSLLEKNGNNDVTEIEFEGLNHLFQESETGMPFEYALIDQTFSPLVMQTIADWIKTRTK